MKKVFLDANVLIDLFSKKEFSKYSIKAVEYLINKNKKVNLCTSSDIITTVYYILDKHTKNKKTSLQAVKEISELMTLIEFSNEEVKHAVTLMEKDRNFRDFEDTLQYVLAKNEGCDLVLSNDKSFCPPDPEVLNTKEFCKRWKIL